MKKLTRILALTLCCLLAAGLAACGETPAPTPTPIPIPVRQSAGTPRSQNPRVPYENDEFPDFKLAGYPDRDGMKPTGFYLIGGTIREISYETATLRCAADTGEGEDLSGVYYPDAEESELSVCHSYGGIITVTVKEHSEGTVALWKSCAGDFDYSLWLPGQTGDAAKALVMEFAAGVYGRKARRGDPDRACSGHRKGADPLAGGHSCREHRQGDGHGSHHDRAGGADPRKSRTAHRAAGRERRPAYGV
ncbi:MAG: hypothetical protein ACLTY5_08615 [Angelakisella sp.]